MKTGPHISVFAAIAMICLSTLLVDVRSAQAQTCLGQQQTRQAIDAGLAKHLAEIKQDVRRYSRGDVIKAQLCQSVNRYIYKLTILSRSGRVTRLQVDARTGAKIGN